MESPISRDSRSVAFSKAASAYATVKVKKRVKRFRKRQSVTSAFYTYEELVSPQELAVQEILEAAFPPDRAEGTVVSVRRRMRTAPMALAAPCTNSTKSILHGNARGNNGRRQQSSVSVSSKQDCSVVEICLQTPLFAAESLTRQHDMVWQALTVGFQLMYDTAVAKGVGEVDGIRPAEPVVTDHRQYTYVGAWTKRLPEFQCLPPGLRVEIRTQIPESVATVLPSSHVARPTTAIASLLPDEAFMKSLQGFQEANYKERVVKETQAAVVIQHYYRQHLVTRLRRIGIRLHRAATTIGRWFRGCIGRKYTRLYRASRTLFALDLQRICRGHAAREWYKRTRADYISASCTIQRVFRGMVGRRYAAIVSAYWSHTVKLQCAIRMHLAKRVARRLRQRKLLRSVILPGVVSMQAVWRGARERRIHRLTRIEPAAAVLVQCAVRAWRARMAAALERKRRYGAITVQRVYHGWHARKLLCQLQKDHCRNKAAIILQSAARMWICMEVLRIRKKRQFENVLVRPAAARISSWFLRVKQRVQFRQFTRLSLSATRIQLWYRHCCFQRRWALQHRIVALVRIQSFVRKILARRLFRLLKFEHEGQQITAVLLLQRWWRGNIVRWKVKPQLEMWRIQRIHSQLSDWRMLELALLRQIRQNAVDQKALKKLRQKAERRLDEARYERAERKERLIQISHEQKELTKDDDYQGWTEALEREAWLKARENEMCAEEILSKRVQLEDKVSAALDLKLEWLTLCDQMDYARCEQECLNERLHTTEIRLSLERRRWDKLCAESKQRRRWLTKEARPKSRRYVKAAESLYENDYRSSLKDVVGTALPKPNPLVAQPMSAIASRLNALPLQQIAALVQSFQKQ